MELDDAPRFRVLGQLEVVRRGSPVTVAAAKQRVALAALLLQANHLVTSDELIERIWGSEPPANPFASLYTHMARLRRTLRGGRELIRTHDLGYSIQVTPETLDVLRFRRLTELATEARARDDAAREARLLREALAMWRGPVLADVASASLHRDVVPILEEERLRAQERWFEVSISRGEPAEVIPDLQAAVDAHPSHERFWAQLMVALSRTGRQSEALRTYRKVRDLLGELGLDPGPKIQQARRDITAPPEPAPDPPPRRRADAAPEPAAGPAFGPAAGPGAGPASAPALGSAAGPAAAPACAPAFAPVERPAELPADNGAFTGRAAEVEFLRDHMTAGRRHPAIVAITGAGGVGKSALAVHVAHRVAGHFPDGQLYADLRGATLDGEPPRPVEVLGRFLRSLGVAEPAVPDSAEEAGARFRSLTSGRRLLVVLDNARDADQVRPLIPGGLGCGVVITSRRLLAPIGGAVHRDLGVLPGEDAGLLLSRLVGPERIEAEPQAVADVVRLCGGLPLALTVVAARLAARPAWTVTAMRDRLATEPRRLAELQVDGRAVRAGFEAGYRDLVTGGDDAAARLFRLLGALGCADVGVEAAAALAGLSAGRADELLESLVACRLLDAPGPGRYHMNDLLRLYARERAQACDAGQVVDAAVRRVLHCYLATGRSATPLLDPAAGWRAALGPATGGDRRTVLAGPRDVHAWVDAEAANMVTLVRLAAGRDDDLTVALVAALAYPLHVRGRWRQELLIAELGVESAERTGNVAYQAFAYTGLGTARSQLGHLAEADQCFERALGDYRRIGDTRRAAVVLDHTGTVCRRMGMPDRAVERHLEALRLHRAHADRRHEGVTLTNLGLAHQRAGRLGAAFDAHRQAVAALRTADALRPLAGAIGNLAETHRLAGDPDTAVERYREALALDGTGGHGGSYGEAARLWGLGRAYHDLRRAGEARECWREAAEVLRRLGLISPAEQRAIRASAIPHLPDVIERHL
ncbi:BTAD domain-containing putative transcriptional regulator [Nonomuraea sp. JJY05]|uniref:AfsR/SARP family transcriptional regulator n=1 Tax=Nonomuraea sp. JJY05 TaxID=3350255 RepID=UPI00373FC171